MQLIDTHVHLFAPQFDGDRAAVLERAAEAGVARMIAIGYDLPTSVAALDLADAHPHIWATAGIQPHYASETGLAELDRLRTMLHHPRVVALGEIGLDYHHDRAPRSLQAELFRRQLALAREMDLPVVIHTREAHADTLMILREAAQGLRIVMHSFSGDWQFAQLALELGAYLSFSGPVTFPKAAELHEVAQRTPLDRLLIETDCPYLAPQNHRGRRNEPAYVREIAERIAVLRGLPVAEVAAATWTNAATLFGLMKPNHVGAG
ncbi:MAG: TatD family hydrolase [Herpetosiphonaceae bacterium]|nr:TatD family hydrolase [Herpetosiphonaceae bacterium]